MGITLENCLRMKIEMAMKEKDLVFLPPHKKRKAESHPTFGTLPFAQHTSRLFAKVKEPNFYAGPFLESIY